MVDIAYRGGAFCLLRVMDVERSLAWYQRVLGFEPVYVLEEVGYAELRAPFGEFAIGMSRYSQVPKGGNAVVALGVPSVDEARGRLEEAGVQFEGITRQFEGYMRFAPFADPDGNQLMLFERLEEAGPAA